MYGGRRFFGAGMVFGIALFVEGADEVAGVIRILLVVI
jgi:hypothetical protein